MALNPAAVTPVPPQRPDLMVPPQPGGIYGDVTSLNTLAGQNTSPPSEKMFGSHYIVKVNSSLYSFGQGPYFDPSYGVTYLDANDMELKAIDGYAKPDVAFPTDPARFVVIPANYWGIGPLHKLILVP
jgi:hypothetical protein